MEILLSKKYKLESDPIHGYNLFERKLVEKLAKGSKRGKNAEKTGEFEEVWKIIGYNMTIEGALNKAINLNLHTKNVQVNLKEFLELYKKEKAELTQLLMV